MSTTEDQSKDDTVVPSTGSDKQEQDDHKTSEASDVTPEPTATQTVSSTTVQLDDDSTEHRAPNPSNTNAETTETEAPANELAALKANLAEALLKQKEMQNEIQEMAQQQQGSMNGDWMNKVRKYDIVWMCTPPRISGFVNAFFLFFSLYSNSEHTQLNV
eukprot:1125369_1